MSQARVEIYTKFGCGYCTRAKGLLNSKGVTFTEYDVTMGGPDKVTMLERNPNARTVPQIFIDDQLIGGCDDLFALDAKGELDPQLGL